MTKQLNSKNITELLNGTIMMVKSIVPIEYDIIKPRLINEQVKLTYGVLIGITGDVKAQLIITGSTSLFSLIGEKMYGMPLEGDMLFSFSGELGNMIAGGLSTNIAERGTVINITTPTIISETTTLTGYDQIVQLPFIFKNTGEMNTYLTIN